MQHHLMISFVAALPRIERLVSRLASEILERFVGNESVDPPGWNLRELLDQIRGVGATRGGLR